MRKWLLVKTRFVGIVGFNVILPLTLLYQHSLSIEFSSGYIVCFGHDVLRRWQTRYFEISPDRFQRRNRFMGPRICSVMDISLSNAYWGLWLIRSIQHSHLSMEIGQEYLERIEKEESTDDLLKLAMDIVPFFLSHNAEADACDLLMELEKIDLIIPLVDHNTFGRVCLYLTRYHSSNPIHVTACFSFDVLAASIMCHFQMTFNC